MAGMQKKASEGAEKSFQTLDDVANKSAWCIFVEKKVSYFLQKNCETISFKKNYQI
jgi:hypothetical protein